MFARNFPPQIIKLIFEIKPFGCHKQNVRNKSRAKSFLIFIAYKLYK